MPLFVLTTLLSHYERSSYFSFPPPSHDGIIEPEPIVGLFPFSPIIRHFT